MIVFADGTFEGSVGGGELESRVILSTRDCLKTGIPITLEYDMSDPEKGDPGVCGGHVEVFVEPLITQRTILVIGVGHVGKAVIRLAKWMGYHVVASDDRKELCTPDKIPEADDHIPDSILRIPEFLNITNRTSIVLTTRGVDVDVEGLPILLDSNAEYIGVIGSRRRWKTAREQLIEKGVSEESLSKVHSPIGIEINAETPEEIAVSILAEMTMLQNGGDGQMMSKT
jgi:xanthine dehydrogenase accessory factor